MDSQINHRCFFGFSITKPFQQALEEKKPSLKKALTLFPIRWVPSYNYHITLKFLGTLDQNRQAQMSEHLQTFQGFSLKLEPKGWELMGQISPRAITLEFTNKYTQLQKTIQAFNAHFEQWIEPIETFRRHLTFARHQGKVDPLRKYEIQEALNPITYPKSVLVIDALILYRSVFVGKQVHYDPIAKKALQATH